MAKDKSKKASKKAANKQKQELGKQLKKKMEQEKAEAKAKKEELEKRRQEKEAAEAAAAAKEAAASASSFKFALDEQGVLRSIKGFKNLGNTCFMNSVLQSLMQTKPLVKGLIDMRDVFPDADEAVYPPGSTGAIGKRPPGLISLTLAVLFKQYYAAYGDGQNAISPTQFFTQVQKRVPQFRGFRQQDAHELFVHVCANVSDEINAAYKRRMEAEAYEKNAESDGPIEKPKVPDVDPDNLVDSAFNIGLLSTIVCHNCGHVSVTRQNDKNVSASIPKSGLFGTPTSESEDGQPASGAAEQQKLPDIVAKHMLNPDEVAQYLGEEFLSVERSGTPSISSCLWDFFKVELLSGENGYICEKCSHVPQPTAEGAVNSDSKVASGPGESASSEESKKPEGSTAKPEDGNQDKDADSSDSSDDEQEGGSEEADKKEDEEEDEEEPKKKKQQDKKKPSRPLRDASKQLSISSPPDVLVVQLKRFIQRSRRSALLSMFGGFSGLSKDSSKVCTQDTIDLTPFVHPTQREALGNKKPIYDLYAIVEHSGDMSGGHYVAYTRQLQLSPSGQSSLGQWHYISDSHAHSVTEKQALGAQPYILFYQRRNEA